MTAMTPASSLDAASAVPFRALKILSEPPSEGHFGTLLRELTASWHPTSTVADRRREHRFRCDLSAALVPLDNKGRILAGVPLEVRVKDLSRHGVGIVHPDPMPYRLALLAFSTAENETVRLLIRLKWCRFKRANFYESGGQILRVLKAGESPLAAAGGPLRACWFRHTSQPDVPTRTIPEGDRPTEPERRDD